MNMFMFIYIHGRVADSKSKPMQPDAVIRQEAKSSKQ
jgi:hypothetical protein